MALRPSSVQLHVPLPAPPESSLPEVPDPESNRARAASLTVARLLATAVTDPPPSVGGECALGTNVLQDRQEDLECLAAAVPRFSSMLLAPEGDPDAPDIPTPRSYVESITGAEPQGAASFGGSSGASPSLSPQLLREWLVRRPRLRSGASGAGGAGAGAAGARGTGVAAGAGVPGGTATTGPRGARTWGTGAAGTGGVEGAGAAVLTESGSTGAGGAGAGGAGDGGPGAGDSGVGGPGVGGAGAGGAGAIDPGGTVRPRAYFVPLLKQVLGIPPSTAFTPPLLCPPPDQSQPPLQPASPLPAPFLYMKQSRPVLPIYYATALVAESASASPPSVGGECALCTDVLEDREEDFECLAAAVPRFASMLLAPEGDPDAPDFPTPRSYAEAITGPYSSQWQAAMDAKMASWKSTGTYVDEVTPPWANMVDGMWIFRVKRPSVSPLAFKARYVA
ncbi:unnamed protein product [Closterium sp. NIES-54]